MCVECEVCVWDFGMLSNLIKMSNEYETMEDEARNIARHSGHQEEPQPIGSIGRVGRPIGKLC